MSSVWCARTCARPAARPLPVAALHEFYFGVLRRCSVCGPGEGSAGGSFSGSTKTGMSLPRARRSGPWARCSCLGLHNHNCFRCAPFPAPWHGGCARSRRSEALGCPARSPAGCRTSHCLLCLSSGRLGPRITRAWPVSVFRRLAAAVAALLADWVFFFGADHWSSG